MSLWRHFTQICPHFPPACTSGTPQARSGLLIFTGSISWLPSTSTTTHSRTLSCTTHRDLGLILGCSLQFYWIIFEMRKTRMDSIFKVCIHCGFTQWNPYSLARSCWPMPVEGLCLIVVTTVVKIPFWVWSKEAPCVTVWNHDVKCCRSWDIWVYILSRSAGVCKHTSSHPREYPAVRLEYVKLFHPSPFEAVQDSKCQREHTAGDSATFRSKISSEFWCLFQGLYCFDKTKLSYFFINTGKVRKIKKRSNVWGRYTNNIYIFNQNMLFDRMWSEYIIFIPSTVKHMLTPSGASWVHSWTMPCWVKAISQHSQRNSCICGADFTAE